MSTENTPSEDETYIEATVIPENGDTADHGAPQGAQGEQAEGESSPSGDHTVGMLCHLLSFIGFIGVPFGNILGPLVIWLMKKDEDAFVDEVGKEVLNFQISVTIYGLVCGVLTLVVIGFFLLPILLILVVVFTIIGAMKANEGILYRYPLTIRFLK
jgi:uncharacterized Tic20 family protein